MSEEERSAAAVAAQELKDRDFLESKRSNERRDPLFPLFWLSLVREEQRLQIRGKKASFLSRSFHLLKDSKAITSADHLACAFPASPASSLLSRFVAQTSARDRDPSKSHLTCRHAHRHIAQGLRDRVRDGLHTLTPEGTPADMDRS